MSGVSVHWRRLCAMPAGLAVLSCVVFPGVLSGQDAGTVDRSPMYRFTETDARAARVTLHSDRVSDYRVSEGLFGKFTEVLGHNTYHGFWAQVLENPSLEPASACLPFRRRGFFFAPVAADCPVAPYNETRLPPRGLIRRVGLVPPFPARLFCAPMVAIVLPFASLNPKAKS